MPPKIDPATGERIEESPAVQIDPATGERMAASPSTPNKTDPSVKSTVSAEPPWYTPKGLKVLGYKAADKVLDVLPTAGGIVGGVAAGGAGLPSGPGALATAAGGAALGGAAGESARQLGKRALFGTGPESSTEAAKQIALQGGIQGGSELMGGVLSKGFTPAINWLGRTASESAASGVRLLPSEAHTAPSSYLERFLKGSVLTSGKMEAFRTAQNAETKAAAEKVAAQISSFNGSAEQLGKMVQEGIDKYTEGFRLVQNRMYSEIDKEVAEKVIKVPMQVEHASSLVDASGKPLSFTTTVMQNKLTGPAMPSMSPLKEFASAQLERLAQEEKILDPTLLESTRKTLEHIVNSPERVTFQGMRDARSDMLALSRKLDEALPGKRAGFAKKMASLADESMMDAAEKSGIPGLPEKVRAANAYTAEGHRVFEQQLVKKIVDTKKPEAIAKFIRGNSVGLEETRDLLKLLPSELRAKVQKQVVSDVMSESVNAQTGAFNERKFATLITKLGEERGAQLFGKNWGNIKELSQLMSRINGPSGIAGGSGAALQNFAVLKNMMLTAAAPFGLAASHHPIAAAGSLAGEWATLNTLASAMTNPAAAVKMLKVARQAAKHLPYLATGAVNVARNEYGLPASHPVAQSNPVQ